MPIAQGREVFALVKHVVVNSISRLQTPIEDGLYLSGGVAWVFAVEYDSASLNLRITEGHFSTSDVLQHVACAQWLILRFHGPCGTCGTNAEPCVKSARQT